MSIAQICCCDIVYVCLDGYSERWGLYATGQQSAYTLEGSQQFRYWRTCSLHLLLYSTAQQRRRRTCQHVCHGIMSASGRPDENHSGPAKQSCEGLYWVVSGERARIMDTLICSRNSQICWQKSSPKKLTTNVSLIRVISSALKHRAKKFFERWRGRQISRGGQGTLSLLCLNRPSLSDWESINLKFLKWPIIILVCIIN